MANKFIRYSDSEYGTFIYFARFTAIYPQLTNSTIISSVYRRQPFIDYSETYLFHWYDVVHVRKLNQE